MNQPRRTLITSPLALAMAAALPPPAHAATPVRKTIPSSGEELPAIGVGTARRYQGSHDAATLGTLRATLRRFTELGGTVIDTAPSYGNAEAVVGSLLPDLPPDRPLFLATKVGATGRAAGEAQVQASFRRLGRDRLDLVAVHNLQDTATQLELLRELKHAGRIRYVGATTSNDRQYANFEAMMARETLDFIQVDYALDNRGAAERLLPLARERRMAVMVNLPFGRGRLFQATRDKPLPAWASEFDCGSWAQFFLKYLIGHEAVTCVIPGMARPEYVVDNMGAAFGRTPDAATRKRMEAFIDAI